MFVLFMFNKLCNATLLIFCNTHCWYLLKNLTLWTQGPQPFQPFINPRFDVNTNKIVLTFFAHQSNIRCIRDLIGRRLWVSYIDICTFPVNNFCTNLRRFFVHILLFALVEAHFLLHDGRFVRVSRNWLR